MKKVFVTGTNGLLGTNLVIELINHNFYVKGLVRNLESYKGEHYPNLELVQGSIFDNLSTAISDCSYVIHVAAETGQNLTSYSEYFKTNVEGTLNVLKAAIQNNIEKFVFVSTANTIGYLDSNSPEIENENQPMKYPLTKSFYALSKFEAEKNIANFANKICIITANPTFMLGAYDTKPSSGKIILIALNKKVLFYPSGGKNFVHVKDVAMGLINCLEYGQNGEKYLLSGENLSYHDFFLKLNAQTGKKPLMIKIPKLFLVALGYLGDLLRKLGIKTSISSANMRILCIHNFYSNKKSTQQLKLKYNSVNKAISDALNYFRHNFNKT